ncbi:lasso RiPP family leader peptide-containing protein [Actinomadura vinacea]|uniref:lasso RiPP family leader peptide-containing protein n=1 Tax=Actinomadura vinacea TaxID=115336 RepID=UPI0031E3A896
MRTIQHGYEPPSLTGLGAFSAVTLGVMNWGWDYQNHCHMISGSQCPPAAR